MLNKIPDDELGKVAGGVKGKSGSKDGPWMEVANLKSGWLALRSKPAYDYNNEIGKLYNGDDVQIVGNSSGDYSWVWAPKLNKSGYVNSSFLKKKSIKY